MTFLGERSGKGKSRRDRRSPANGHCLKSGPPSRSLNWAWASPSPDNPPNAVMIDALADIHKRRRSSLANGLALAAGRRDLQRLWLNASLLLHGNIWSASCCSTSRLDDGTESSRSLHTHWEQTSGCRQSPSTWILSDVSKVLIVRLALMLTHIGGSTFVALPSSPRTESIDIKAVKNRCPGFFPTLIRLPSFPFRVKSGLVHIHHSDAQ